MATEFERTLSPEFVRECFEDREGVVYWSERPEWHFRSPQVHQGFLAKYANKPAGRTCGNGYVSIHIRIEGVRRQLQAHRVVWLLHFGDWPTQYIDHKNRIRDDNRIENLRDVSMEENLRNNGNPNGTGILGVRRAGEGKFAAQIRVGVRPIHLGTFGTVREAQIAYNDAAESMIAVLQSSRRGRAALAWREDAGAPLIALPVRQMLPSESKGPAQPSPGERG